MEKPLNGLGLDRIAQRGAVGFEYPGLLLDPASDGDQTFSRLPSGRLLGHHDGSTGSLAGLNRHGDLAYTFGSDGTLTHTATWEPYGVAIDRTGTTPTVGFQADYTDQRGYRRHV